MVVNAAQTEAVLFGEHGAAAAMQPGSVFVMCSTVDPNWSIALEQRLAERGLLYLDAPISGGAAKAASGEMTMMTAGRPEAYAKAGGALDAMAAKVYQLGDRAGNGSKVKIINQLLAGVHIAAAAEAMALGLREGVDAAALYEVITHSAGNSWMFENRMAHVLAATTRRCRRWTSSSRTSGWCSTPRARRKFPLPLARPPRTRCSCRRRRAGHAQGRRQRGDQDLPRHHAAGHAELNAMATTPLLGCIADDFTGATDLANNLVRAGMRTVQTIGVPEDATGTGRSRRGGRRAQVAHHRAGRGGGAVAARRCAGCVPQGVAAGLLQVLLDLRLHARTATSARSTDALLDALHGQPGSGFTIACPAFPRTSARSSRAICSSATCCSATAACATTR